ncbi:MAG: hypothetical protein EPN60_03180 [Nevskiaceae bacterium]|nr:MAG: hypothetical protein EPO48_06920 [Nevskiaceae bacterium]TAM32850.1 MAG: hypothetical protein EPN60_03180 [Nevskiaceae bacterium]
MNFTRRNRLHAGLLLSFAGLSSLTLLSLASEPTSHDVTIPTSAGQTVVLEWTGTIPAGATAGVGADCSAPQALVSDTHTINLAVPEGAYDSVNISADFSIEWDDGIQDEALAVTKDGETIGTSDGGEPQEVVSTSNPGAGVFVAIACPYTAVADTPYRGRLTLTATAKTGSGSGAPSPAAGTGNASGLPPRFHHYAPDYKSQGFGMYGGEATLDVNWKTGSIFYLGFLETLRLRLDDSTSPAIQTWEKNSTIATDKATSDPILVGDRDTGRIFATQLLAGAGTSAMDYTDDDGESYTPGMAGSVLRSGADHQAMDVGPYPAGSSIPHPTYPNAIYYCSQDVALAYCSRSDDGGVTFGPSTPIYTQGNCNGLHGHVKVAADGTVYVPNSKCVPLGGGVGLLANRPAAIVSEDAGLTWEVRFVGEATSGGGADPSIASATDGTVYYSYVDENFNLHMAKSADKGVTWTNDINIGALAGITKAEFPAVVAGDPDRAAVAFFGSTLQDGSDPENAEGFGGSWHLYLAATYDGGATYHVVDLTPNDPIQRGPICGGNYCRNLLDFFDAVIDPQGRIVIAYEDGCVGGCVTGGMSQYTDQAVIARQSGGRTMFAANDPVEPAEAGAPRLDGYRTANFVYLEWPTPDTGGSEVSEYRVYRGSASGALTLLGKAGKNGKFVDSTPPAGTAYYRVSAVNAQGEGAMGNELALAVGDKAPTPELACALPGLQVATDLVGEYEAPPLTRDLEQMFIAEPEDMPGKIVITEKIAQAAPQQAGAYFFVHFDTSVQKDRTYRARFSVDGMPLDYWEGTTEPTDDTLDQQRVYTSAGTLEAGSGFTSDGYVRFVLDKDKLGLKTGDKLLGVNGRSFATSQQRNTLTDEAGYFDYTLQGNDFCAKGGIVLPPVIDPPPGGGPVVPPPGSGANASEGRFGGALGAGLLPLLLLALRRRRSQVSG